MSLQKSGKVSMLRGGGGERRGREEEEEEEAHRILAEWKRLIKERTRRLIRSTPSPSMLISLSSALASNDSKESFKQVAGGVEGPSVHAGLVKQATCLGERCRVAAEQLGRPQISHLATPCMCFGPCSCCSIPSTVRGTLHAPPACG